MATSARRKAVARKTVNQAATAPDEGRQTGEGSTFDEALDRWSDVTARELAAFSLGTSHALLRGLQAVQEAQLEVAREVCKAHEQAAAEAGSIRDVGDLARLQMSLAQSDGQAALASLSRIGAVGTQQALETWNDAARRWTELSSHTWDAALQWLDGMARQPADAEMVEAEVEHVVNPFTASPFAWPAQEVARQAMTVAGSAWNEWLNLSGQMAQAGQDALGGARPSR